MEALREHCHTCFSCGARSGPCVDRCLDRCGCSGKPRCPHFPCTKCRDTAPVTHYHALPLPWEVEDVRQSTR